MDYLSALVQVYLWCWLYMAYISGSSEDPKQTEHLSYSSLSSFIPTPTSQISRQSDRDCNNVSGAYPLLEDTSCGPYRPLDTITLSRFGPRFWL